jgi:bifunctional non-homologous end joining protein LigD
MRLSRRSEPFDSDQFIYELKIDGFRALAYIRDGQGQLVSRNGNVFSRFCRSRCVDRQTHARRERGARWRDCLCGRGRTSIFRDLLFRWRQCVFIAFDLLYLNGKDLRTSPLIERKAMLKRLLRRKRSRVLYLDHVESDGRLLFEEIVKRASSANARTRRTRVTEKPFRYWIKVKNSGYCQLEGHEELFERIAASNSD